METLFVKILDKQIPYELLESYVMILCHYEQDHLRSRAHDKMFEYMGVIRRGPGSIDDETGDLVSEKYADKIADFVCEAFCCCGRSVLKQTCEVCGEELTMQDSLAHMKKYLKLKKLLFTE